MTASFYYQCPLLVEEARRGDPLRHLAGRLLVEAGPVRQQGNVARVARPRVLRPGEPGVQHDVVVMVGVDQRERVAIARPRPALSRDPRGVPGETRGLRDSHDLRV